MLKARLAQYDFLEIVAASNLSHLPFTAEDAMGVRSFSSLTGHDPIDVALLAQARNNRLDFVTADRKLLALDLPWVIDATV
jgi:PIN domain nuclease of toxin-antitoxin system